MLTIHFDDVRGWIVETAVLTSGMTGAAVKFVFTDDWESRKKTAVFTAGSTTRDVLDVGDEVVIPHEVLQNYGDRLYVGIYGVSEDGTVTPTIYVKGPLISKGADPSGDESTQDTLPVWGQLLNMIGKLKNQIEEIKNGGGCNSEQTAALAAMFAVCVADDDLGDVAAARAKFNAAFGITESGDIGGGEEEPDTPVTPEKTLANISAVYSGGDVAVGTAVTALTGIVVTAHYSDGSSENVSGYTLSGTIGDGINTITVSYDGMTTAFTVTGVAESSGDEGDDETRNWSIGYFDTSGNVVADAGYLYCEEYLPVSPGDTCYLSNTDRVWKGAWSGWATYDANKNPVGRLNSDAVQGIADNGRCLFTSTVIPDGIAFVRVSTDAFIDAYKDTAVIGTTMPEPVCTLADAVWYEGYVAGNGRIESEAGCWYSDLISVEAGAKYRFGNSDPAWNNTWCGIGFYSGITEQFVSRVTAAEFTVPDGVKYLRLSAQNMTGCCDTATLEKIS